jgi:hypothetical protein
MRPRKSGRLQGAANVLRWITRRPACRNRIAEHRADCLHLAPGKIEAPRTSTFRIAARISGGSISAIGQRPIEPLRLLFFP